MNLAENEMDWLARHLGHDIRIHREFYRMHESSVELAKISKLLYASEKGDIHLHAGGKLDDIPVPDLSEFEKYSTDDEDNPPYEPNINVIQRKRKWINKEEEKVSGEKQKKSLKKKRNSASDHSDFEVNPTDDKEISSDKKKAILVQEKMLNSTEGSSSRKKSTEKKIIQKW